MFVELNGSVERLAAELSLVKEPYSAEVERLRNENLTFLPELKRTQDYNREILNELMKDEKPANFDDKRIETNAFLTQPPGKYSAGVAFS